jgi:hypothetical protein
MPYPCSIYGIGVLANREIPGVPASQTSPVDLQITFGSLPEWFGQTNRINIEPFFVADYTDESGQPLLKFFCLDDGDYYRFSYADQTEFVVNKDGSRVWGKWSESLTLEDAATYLLGPVMGFVLLLRGVVCLHASAVAIGDRAIALVGPAGSGKSTTAAAFANRGHSILAEDVVTLDDRETHFLVRPAYPCIRLWPASVAALYGSETELPRLTPNWDKRYLDLTEQFPQLPLPLAAIYHLDVRRDEPHAPYIKSLDKSEGLMSLVANTYATKLMNKQMRAREFELLTRVSYQVPLRRVTPHSDTSRIPELCDRIIDDFASQNPSHLEDSALHV